MHRSLNPSGIICFIAYDSAKKEMDNFVKDKEDRKPLEQWVSWWRAKCGYIFHAFAPKDAPQMNQAEVIHASWAHRDRSKLSILDACQADVHDSLVLVVTLKQCQHGLTRGGLVIVLLKDECQNIDRKWKKQTTWVKRYLRMRTRDCLSILNDLTFPTLPRKERKIYNGHHLRLKFAVKQM